jgi:hypothetical protein
MKAILRIGGGATEEIMTVTGDGSHPFIELAVRGREILLTRSEARMASDALRALALNARSADVHLPPPPGSVRDDPSRAGEQ